MMDIHYKIGIDIGSTTIKTVITSLEGVVYKNYERHFSEISGVLNHHLKSIRKFLGSQAFSFAVTGSSGLGISQRFGLPFIQEVIACTGAVKKLIPQTDTAIELGGEDAKITYFDGAVEQRMNGACAGGTGAFIDQIATLLSTDAQGLNALALKGKQIYTIASRCGVFAKTDVQALMNDGASREDIALSVFQAVVNQTIGNLAQGRPISGKVAFLGGPLYFLPVLKERFIATLKLKKQDVIDVDNGCYFVALGAAFSNEAKVLHFGDLDKAINHHTCLHRVPGSAIPRLFENRAEYESFRQRHSLAKVKRGDPAAYSGPLYLGIDAGSTTTKLAAIGKNKELLYTVYGSNLGTPLDTVRRELAELYSRITPSQYLAGTVTTGYGEQLIKAAFHADYGEVETFAHLRAAREFCPEVSFVMDIGGQDMKCFFVKDGVIGSITLNEACSAGCGSFIETFAKSLNLTAAEFALKAVESHNPVDLGTRCTVFMNSKVKQAQKEGAPLADISAGISISVIKNALFKVMQLRDVSLLGDKIVVQGGTFLNDAVLRAMEKINKREVIRPDVAGLMGAYGAAILALEHGFEKTSLLSAAKLDQFSFTSKSYRCNRCGNHCMITMQRFPDGGRYYSGNRCEKGTGGGRRSGKVRQPNIYEYKYERLFGYKPLQNAPRGQIGIPRVLNLYEDYPFWFTFFTTLGYEVVLSDNSSAALYYDGMSTVPSDSLCYPAKLAHGHICNLISRGIKKIFYPCLPQNLKNRGCASDNRYNCPVVASYAENIRTNMDILWEKQIKFLQPFLPIADRKRLLKRLQQELKDEHLPVRELKAALEAAYTELEHYKQDVAAFADQVLSSLTPDSPPVVVLAGRPYHIDPEINHGIPEMISSYGLPILSEDSLSHLPVKEQPSGLVNQWSYHARLYHAAEYTVEHPGFILIQLSSFGCGLDAITTDQVKSILERRDHIYTMIKLDEVSNLGAARIRLRSLLAAISRRRELAFEPIPFNDRPRFTKERKKTNTILAPQMAPIHFELAKTVLHNYGYNIVIPPMPDRSAIDLGLRYVNNDMCYPAVVVVGQLLAALKSGKYDPEQTSIILFQTCGACRATNYISVLRRALAAAGFSSVPVFALYGLETDAFRLSRKMFRDLVHAAVYGDLLMNVLNRVRPYELTRGSSDALCHTWLQRCKEELRQPRSSTYKRNIQQIVQDFEALPIDETIWKPKVGVVGEILVKYHPVANNQLEQVLLQEGAEVVMPDLVDFFLYLGCDDIIEHNLLDGKLSLKMLSGMFIKVVERMRSPMVKALQHSRRFTAPGSIKHTAALAQKVVSLGNMAGEGWFLTGEMLKLIDSGVKNIVCLQPFGCLPNHITGKGVLHEIRRLYHDANIVPLDCDAGACEVNLLNRLKLMLAVAKEHHPLNSPDIPGTASPAPGENPGTPSVP